MHSIMRARLGFCSHYKFNIIPQIIYQSGFTCFELPLLHQYIILFYLSCNIIFSLILVPCLDSFLASACTQKYLALHRLHTFRFPSNYSRELNVFWHDGDPLGRDGTQVCIFKETNNVRLRSH